LWSAWGRKAVDSDFVAITPMRSDYGIFVSTRAEFSGNQMRLELVSNRQCDRVITVTNLRMRAYG
jgi:hypothetical protein